MKRKRTIWHGVVWLLSGEWMLRHKSNGGGTILARALFVTILLYAVALAVRDLLQPQATLHFDARELTKGIRDTLPWFGAIFAGVYASFYARFASQWSYLAGVYNQIKAAEVQAAPFLEKAAPTIAEWKAGFIEDADTLHLSEKKMIRGIIGAWLPHEKVQEYLVTLTPDGEEVLNHLCKSHGVRRLVDAKGNLLPPAA